MAGGDDKYFARQGDPLDIPAKMQRRWQAAATWVENQKGFKQGHGNSAVGSGGLVLIKNTSGTDRDRFDILGIDTIIIQPTDNLAEFQNNFALSCKTPALKHFGKFVVCNEPIPNGAMGMASIYGLCVVRADGIIDPGDRLDVLDGDGTKLSRVFGGSLQALYGQDVAGVHWALCRFVGAGPTLLKLTGNATGFGKYTCHLMGASAGSGLLDPSTNLGTGFGVEGTVTAYAWNLDEVSGTGHNLSSAGTPPYFWAYPDGESTDSKAVFIIISPMDQIEDTDCGITGSGSGSGS